jgi:hypothetical protein
MSDDSGLRAAILAANRQPWLYVDKDGDYEPMPTWQTRAVLRVLAVADAAPARTAPADDERLRAVRATLWEFANGEIWGSGHWSRDDLALLLTEYDRLTALRDDGVRHEVRDNDRDAEWCSCGQTGCRKYLAAEPVPSCSCGSRALYAEDPPRLGPHHQMSCARWRGLDGSKVVRHPAAEPVLTCAGCGGPLRQDGRGLNTCDTIGCPGNSASAAVMDGPGAPGGG